MATNNRQYINGAFLKETYNKNDSLLINLWIPDAKARTEFLAALAGVPVDEKGGFNLTIGTQKTDKKKYSLWIDDRERGPGGQAPASQQPGYRPAPRPDNDFAANNGAASYNTNSTTSTDDLPF